MASTRSNADWASHISSLTPKIRAAIPSEPYPVPPPAGTIDHTLLALSATPEQVTTLCEQALQHNFASVCVRLPFAPLASRLTSGSQVRVAVVISFHEGTDPIAAKLSESSAAIAAGAHELDVVLNRPPLKEGRYSEVYAELAAIREATRGTVLKLIFETSRLTDDEVLAVSVLAGEAGWEFIKTSTGFDGPGAQIEHVRLMRAVCEVLGGGMKVKASGGIRSGADAEKMLGAGASRLGTSGGVGIVSGQGGGSGY